MLNAVVREARRQGARAYLVGGPVRDLLLGCPLLDVDVLLSNALGPVAVAAAERVGGRAVVHGRFLTARIERDGARLDLSRARREHYAAPGALPEVAPAEIAEDLGRRDFTVHAIAFSLMPGDPEPLLDPFGGVRDLRGERLRMLHPASFIDDPTRLFRAARYSARLGLRFEAETARALREAVEQKALESVSGDRIARELARTLAETRSSRAASRLGRLGLLEAIARGWRVSPRSRAALRRLDSARARPPWPEMEHPEVQAVASLGALLLDGSRGLRQRVLARLGFTGARAARVLESTRDAERSVRWLARERSPGAVDARLGEVREAALLLGACIADRPVARVLGQYATAWRHAPDPIRGTEARRLGLQGPAIGQLLRSARRRALDGNPVDAGWIERWLARHRRMR